MYIGQKRVNESASGVKRAECQCYLSQSSYLFVFLLVSYHWPRSQSMSTCRHTVSRCTRLTVAMPTRELLDDANNLIR